MITSCIHEFQNVCVKISFNSIYHELFERPHVSARSIESEEAGVGKTEQHRASSLFGLEQRSPSYGPRAIPSVHKIAFILSNVIALMSYFI